MDAMDQLKLGIAAKAGLPAEAASQIEGKSLEEMEANAKTLLGALQDRLDSHPNRGELAALAAGAEKPEGDLALLQRLHGTFEPPEPVPSDSKVDFDGGVRQTAPPEPDPLADHNLFVVGLARDDLSEYEWEMRRRNLAPQWG